MTPPDPWPDPDTPQFSTGRSLFLAGILVLAFFGILEVALRIVGVKPPLRPRILLRRVDIDIDFPFMKADPELLWSPRPGYRGEFLGKTVTINDIGLRGPEVRIPKPPGVRRVVCFGDSITFGYGVADEETYAFLLGRTLALRGVEAVNAGVTGYTSSQVLRLLKRLSPSLGADVATFCIGWNDGTRRHAEDRAFERRLRASMAVDSALDRLYLFRAMKSLYLGSVRTEPAGPPSHSRVPLDQYRSNLAGMVEECRSRGIRPVFVALPHRRKAGEPVADSPYPKALAQIARDLDVPLFGASPLDSEAPPEGNEAYFIDSLHFSPAGHQRMASELARQLAGLGVF